MDRLLRCENLIICLLTIVKTKVLTSYHQMLEFSREAEENVARNEAIQTKKMLSDGFYHT